MQLSERGAASLNAFTEDSFGDEGNGIDTSRQELDPPALGSRRQIPSLVGTFIVAATSAGTAFGADYFPQQIAPPEPVGGVEEFSQASSIPDSDLSDRLTLLVQKFASETQNFCVEDTARLEMLNQKLDFAAPRYSESDRAVLGDAVALVEKLRGKYSGIE